MDKKVAIAILGSRRVISDVTKRHDGLRVTHVGYLDKEGQPFISKLTGEEVALVSVNATTPYQLEEATGLFNDGNYQEATRKSLAFEVPASQGPTFGKKEFVNVTLRSYIDDDGNTVVTSDAINLAPSTTKGEHNQFAKKAVTKEVVKETA